MKWRWTPTRTRILWGCALLIIAVGFVLVRGLDELVSWTSILGFFAAVLSLIVSTTSRDHQDTGPGHVQRLNEARQDLAAAVEQQWRTEERLRRVQDPFPLPVRWTAANAMVSDHWIHGGRSTPGAESVNFSGQLEHVVAVFNRVPSRRLVVLGEPGAGKTVLTFRFTLDILAGRKPHDRVPVIFPLASWHPERQSLQSWMTERLCTDYPALSALASTGFSWAWELVHGGCVLPVLDGLDEIPAALRGAALRYLNLAIDHDTPLLVTCRIKEYWETVQVTGVFARAAVVELLPLTLEDLANYLPRTIHRSYAGTDAPAPKWESVLARLEQNAGQPSARAVLDVLANPLMTALARVIYSETDADPAQLLGDQLADPVALEQHLLDAFIPAAYSHQVPMTSLDGLAHERYPANRVIEWLSFLARHINHLGTYDLAWWQHTEAVPPRTRALLVGLSCGLAFGLVATLAAGPFAGLAYGLAFSLAGGLTSGRSHQLKLSRVEIRFQGTMSWFFRRFTIGLVAGVALGFAFKLPGAAVLVLALSFGLAVGLHVWLNLPADATRVSSPLVALRQDRTATLAYGLSFGLPFGIAYGSTFLFSDELPGTFGLPFGLSFGLSFGLAGALAGGIAGSLIYGRLGALAYTLVGAIVGGLVLPPAQSAALAVVLGLTFGLSAGYLAMLSKAWCVFALSRMWLALLGRQPWRLMRFLEDAHQCGVLRQVGGVYQFRHARLQDHLARIRRDLR
jgi:hypothetical protein